MSEPGTRRRGETDARAEGAARGALGAWAGTDPRALSRVGDGLSNHVFEADFDDRRVIVRLRPAEEGAAFARERRVIERVRRAGVPAPEPLALGEEDGFAFMILRRLPGAIARDHPERLRTLRELGALAKRRIHAIRTEGYGCGDGFGDDAPLGDWPGWLAQDYRAEARLDLLRRHQLITAARADELRERLAEVAAWSAPPVLNHGDLRLKNVLVDDEGAIVAVLDWENSLSAPGPHWDLSIALHDLWVDQVEAFLDGYGMDPAEVRAAAPVWRLFNTLNYVPEVQRALNERDTEKLEQIRTRFSGALDLFGDG